VTGRVGAPAARYAGVMWFPRDEPWQYRVLDALPAGVDEAQLREAKRLTPEERIARAEELARLAEELRNATKKVAR
jgi:hypothetical protein